MKTIQINDKINEFFTKLKGIKNIKIIIGLIIVAALILTYGHIKETPQITNDTKNNPWNYFLYH